MPDHRKPYRPTRAQAAMARAIYYMPGGVTRDERTLARRAGTTVAAATRTLRSMGDHGLATRNLSQWSLTSAGHALAEGE
jgi:DNA-binding MarR family transcriptional regulator